MKPGLSLRVSQHLSLTPQLQQSIRLLQLSTLELGQEVEQMLADNPFLERNPDEAPREEFGLAHADTPLPASASADASSTSSTSAGTTDADSHYSDDNHDSSSTEALGWEGDGSVDMAPDDSEWGGDAPAYGNATAEDSESSAADLAHAQESLTAFLHHQTAGLRLSEVGRAALYFLIESLNEDGYLEDSLQALAEGLAGDEHPDELEELLHHFTVALHLLHTLEPVGVGARHLAECLGLQLKAIAAQPEAGISPTTIQVALRICQQPLEGLARRDVRKLAQSCAATEEQTRAAITLIARLEPRPGRPFVSVERNAILPDVLVRRVGNGQAGYQFAVQLNPEVMPRLRIHDIYAGALRGRRQDEGHQALQQRLQEARWFIKNIQQRFDTILRVSKAIVERQKNFFVHGALAMRPLVLREIADELGLHESTISRVTTAKYMATPQGTYELKYFFGSGLGTDSGGNASSTAVRALIQQFIAAENPIKPLSDSQLAEMLKEQGIECARRTVAKYREGLKIPTTTLRKTL